MSASILIVDDDPALLKLLRMLLELEGFEVKSADSAERALSLLATSRPRLLITDLKMSGMDGLALFDAVRKIDPGLPVIILTAHGTIPDAVGATRRGVFGYLTKPFEAEALLSEVRRALQVSAESKAEPDEAWRKEIITRSPAMESLLNEARLIAPNDVTVLISGETGTGKELLARAIHEASGRHPFIAINCGAIPEQLLESELFGHVKGSFTGAVRDHRGLIQSAQGGTLFLDEIGEMPQALQVKLLRVLQDRTLRAIGSTQNIAIDVRIIAATNRDLEQDVRDHRFREDLYYRLNVVTFHLPALRDRREDIPLLANHFLASLAAKYRREVNAFAPDAVERLIKLAWPGNVRQLCNAVEKMVALCTTSVIPTALVERALARQSEELASLDRAKQEFERDYLVRLLKLTNGNVTQAARYAQRNRSEFYSLLHRHHLEPTQFKTD
ncbi:MAG: sigma 54-interacting transcriptional regulator [Burkholderiales bacterium]